MQDRNKESIHKLLHCMLVHNFLLPAFERILSHPIQFQCYTQTEFLPLYYTHIYHISSNFHKYFGMGCVHARGNVLTRYIFILDLENVLWCFITIYENRSRSESFHFGIFLNAHRHRFKNISFQIKCNFFFQWHPLVFCRRHG